MRLFRRSLLCLVIGVTALLIGGALLLKGRSGQLPIPPAGSVEEIHVQRYDRAATLMGERAERARQLFIPARRDHSGTKWEGWGQATMRLRGGETMTYSLFLVKQGHLGAYEVEGQYFKCAAENQLNSLCDLAGIAVDELPIPVELFRKGDGRNR